MMTDFTKYYIEKEGEIEEILCLCNASLTDAPNAEISLHLCRMTASSSWGDALQILDNEFKKLNMERVAMLRYRTNRRCTDESPVDIFVAVCQDGVVLSDGERVVDHFGNLDNEEGLLHYARGEHGFSMINNHVTVLLSACEEIPGKVEQFCHVIDEIMEEADKDGGKWLSKQEQVLFEQIAELNYKEICSLLCAMHEFYYRRKTINKEYLGTQSGCEALDVLMKLNLISIDEKWHKIKLLFSEQFIRAVESIESVLFYENLGG